MAAARARRGLWAGLVVGLAAGWMAMGFSGRALAVEASEGFVQLSVNQELMISYFEVYLDEAERPYLHFDSFMKAVELPIRFDPALHHAGGTLADRSTPYDLNLDRLTLEVGGQRFALPSDGFILRENGLYLRYDLIGQGLPLTLDWSLSNYALAVRVQYPLLSQKISQARRRRAELDLLRAERESHPVQERELAAYDPGMFQFQTTVLQDSLTGSSGRFALAGIHRVAWADLDYSITQPWGGTAPAQGRLDYARLSWYDTLNQNGAVLGDTYTTFSPLLAPTLAFRGGSFWHGAPNNLFGGTTLIGTAPPGSSVDLYRLGVLIGYTQVGDDGFYRFEKVPLSESSTQFEIHIFTPAGEHLVDYQRVTSYEKVLEQGGWSASGGAGQAPGIDPYQVAGVEGRYGVADWLTLGGGYLQLKNNKRDGELLPDLSAAGLVAMARPLDWAVLLMESESGSGGGANRASLFQSFDWANITLERRGYQGELYPPARTRDFYFSQKAWELGRSQLSVSTRLAGTNIALSQAVYDYGLERQMDQSAIRLDRRLFSRMDMNLTLTTEKRVEAGLALPSSTTTGLLSTYRAAPLTQLTATYNQVAFSSGQSVSSYGLSLQKTHQITSPWMYALGYEASSSTLSSGPAAQPRYSAALGYLFPFSLRLVGEADNQPSWRLTAEYIQPFRVSGEGWEAIPQEKFRRSGLAGVVFVDTNGNGVWDDGEETLADVRVVAPGVSGLVTNRQGRYAGWGMPPQTVVTVQLDLLTLDALYVPVAYRTRLVGRPGEMVWLAIPVVPAGGLDGRVEVAGRQKASPLAGLMMEVVDGEGLVRASGMVEYDGSFTVEGIPPGGYLLRPNPEDLKKTGYAMTPEGITIQFPVGVDPFWKTGVVMRAAK